jgi:hypothetical protein
LAIVIILITKKEGFQCAKHLIYKNNCSSEPLEDKYGHYAMLKKLNDTYRCPCGNFLVYKDDSFKTLICPNPKCGFEKPAPPIPQR